MKRVLNIILFLLLVNISFSQTIADSIKPAADSAVKMFTWDIQQADRGTLMFLDVPYKRENSDSTQYLSLTVARDKDKQRPAFISMIVSNNVAQENGIFITFATRKANGDIELEKTKPIRISFEKCDEETCIARMLDGYATGENGEQTDIFQKFLDMDDVLFLVVYPDGTHKSIAVPLFSFKEQYQKL